MPAREMVFGEDGELGALGGGGADKRGGFGKVVFGVHGLRGGGGGKRVNTMSEGGLV